MGGDIRLIVLLPALQSCGAKVYTSLWETYNGDWWTTRYEGLQVGGANEPKATLPACRQTSATVAASANAVLATP